MSGYTINAEVVDIRHDTPKADDRFFVDTNVWLWFCYMKADRRALVYQTAEYPQYLENIINSHAKALYSVLNIAELAHVIEDAECEIYKGNVGTANLRLKDFRRIGSERKKVVAEIDTAHYFLKNFGAELINISNTECEYFEKGMKKYIDDYLVDGYDAIMLEGIKNSGIKNILTDDSDYASIPGITMFTANPRVICEARNADKLIVRC